MDPRIDEYAQAIESLKNFSFNIRVPTQPDDPLSKIGKSLLELSRMLERKFEELHKISDITQKINSGLLIDQVLDHVFESFESIIPYDRIGLSLLENDGRMVRARWARTKRGEICLPKGYALPIEQTSLQKIISSGKPRILNNLEVYLSQRPGSDPTQKIIQEGMRSSLTCPLIAMGKPIGFLFFSSVQTGAYEHVHVNTFIQIGNQLSVIIEKSRMYQQLLEMNDVRNKFLGMASHDLKNPISILIAYLKILLDEGEAHDPELNRKSYRAMLDISERMRNLVENFLTMSVIEAGQVHLKMQEVDLQEYLDSHFENHQYFAKKKSVTIVFEIEPNLPKVRFDPHRIGQVISNLLYNAIKFSNPQKTVRLTAKQSDGTLEISVTDEGEGIPEEKVSLLFNDFYQLKSDPVHRGTGLGLAISKRMIEAHGGKIRVQSTPGVGSSFIFSIPMETAN